MTADNSKNLKIWAKTPAGILRARSMLGLALPPPRQGLTEEMILTEAEVSDFDPRLSLARLLWDRFSRPTIRLTHGLQSLLLMTRCPVYAPTISDPISSALPDGPFPAYWVQFAEPVELLPPAREGLCADDQRWQQMIDSMIERVSVAAGVFVFTIPADKRWYRTEDDPFNDRAGAPPDAEEVRLMWTGPGSSPDQGLWDGMSLHGWRLHWNLIHYLASIGGVDDTHLTSRKPGKPTLGNKGHKHYTVGREIKLSPQLRALASATNRPNKYRFRSRWLVRGHFRNQPVGPGKADRRVIYIHPHWKGPEGGIELRPIYSCDGGAR